jgi:RNA polymerase sigma-70 factor, ECF subfamily
MQNNELKYIEACLLGDTRAFARLVERYKTMVYSLAFQMSNNYHDAEDIAQEAFLKAYQSLTRYNSHYRFSTWLYQITLNIIRDRYKKNRIRIPSSSLEESLLEKGWKTIDENNNQGNPENKIIERERQERIRKVISKLPLKYREIMVLRHFHDLSYSELSQILKLPMSSVRVRLFRAREKFKKIFEK